MSTPDGATIDPHDVLGYLLKHAAARFAAVADSALERHRIDSKELGVLRMLAGREGTSQLALADALGIDRTTMVAVLDGLERKGVVDRHPDPSDRRRNVAELTQQGQRTYEAAEADYLAAENAFLSALSSGDRAALRRGLRTLVVDPAGAAPAR
ncbi:MarR family winged helix-turn-helix transcriptional regulator [Microbacterium terrisoli]|jgi:DNA-binding MarR family transcriptional regulator|uniref:MarR family winged helix-turn-helix transcriptional regulator n=1 Tax=Microbacterium terrisoli TaxID=3242192 RepID=UPI00280451ED|nr:MarR family winged helix-turn-helix transcriptional regulator [Microbacterium protaetiae]